MLCYWELSRLVLLKGMRNWPLLAIIWPNFLLMYWLERCASVSSFSLGFYWNYNINLILFPWINSMVFFRWCSLVEYLVAYLPFSLYQLFLATNHHLFIPRMRYLFNSRRIICCFLNFWKGKEIMLWT